MSLTVVFRCLMVAALVFTGLGVAVGYLADPYISADWRALVAESGQGSLMPDPKETWSQRPAFAVAIAVCFIVLSIASLAAQVGLFFFWRFARWLMLLLTMIAAVQTLGLGVTVYLPLEEFFFELSLLCQGAILALAYYSPIRERFVRR